VDKNNRLKHQAYDPTPKTDEISAMRLEHMGSPLCRSKAKEFENPTKKKEYRGLALLKAGRVASNGMQIVDSRKHFCGHVDIRLMMQELIDREGGEPLPPETGKRLKDLKDCLLKASIFVSDTQPALKNKQSQQFLSKVDSQNPL